MKLKRFELFISLVLTTLCFINGISLNLLADELNGPSCYSVTSGNEFEVTTSINSVWSQHANVQFTFTNTGSNVIHNWYFTFNMPCSIDEIWEASVVDSDSTGSYTIKHNSYNQDIPVNGSVTIGMILSTNTDRPVEIMPEWYLLNTRINEVANSDYSITYNVQSSLENEFSGNISLVPSVALNDWSLSFASNRTISYVNAGVLSNDINGKYMISNDGNNQNISSGATYNINYRANGSSDGFSLSDINLYTVELAFPLNQDSNSNGIRDYLDFVNGNNPNNPGIRPTNTTTVTNTTIPTGSDIVTDTPVPTEVTEIDWETDSGTDGLPDDFEVIIGTDIYNSDSDSDGLSDYIEVVIGYNPLSNDTDSNGLLDGNEDVDLDGLSNAYELQIGTDISSYDTDGDNLSDGDEVNIYGTNPLKYDTDDDGISDWEEVYIGKNPLDDSDADIKILQTSNSEINNTEDPAILSVDITMATEGYIGYTVYAEDLYDVDVYSTEVLGRVGSPIGLISYVDFEEATVVIHYDENQLGDTEEENLGVLWYNEDTGLYVLQNQAVVDTENNTITMRLTHFSTYVMIDKLIWREPPIIDYEVPSINEEANGVDIIIAIENNGMFTDEERERAIDEAVAIINNAGENDRLGVIIYETNYGSSTLYTYNNRLFSTTTERNQLKVYIRANMRTLDYTNYDDVDAYVNTIIRCAIIIDNNNPDVGNARRIVHITNGRGMNYNYFYGSAYVERESSVPYFAVNVSDNVVGNGDWLSQRCSSTGGNYYYSHRVSYDIVPLLLNAIHSSVNLNEYDSDSDGLPNYLEIQGMYTTYFRIIHTDPYDEDTDNDGLTDYEEIGDRIYKISRTSGDIEIRLNGEIVATYSYYIPEVSDYHCLNAYVPTIGNSNYVYAIKSNPVLVDSDNDGLDDSADNCPLYVKQDIVYIFYSSVDQDYIISEARSRRNDYHCRAVLYPISSRDDFIAKWNSMGEDQFGNPKYNIFEVVTIFHGQYDAIFIGGHTLIDTNDVNSMEIEKKNIKTLRLSSCYNGELGKENLAYSFTNWGTVDEVYAWNCKSVFGLSDNVCYTIMKLPLIVDYDIQYVYLMINIRFVAEFSGEFIDALQYNLIYYLRYKRIDFYLFDNLPEGLLRYYMNSNGEVVYENVSNIGVYIDCFVCF